MRMRKKKNGAQRLEKCKELLTIMPEKPIQDSRYSFDRDAPLWLEIGAGKGGFAIAMAERNPTVCYYAMERVSDCVVLAAEGAQRTAEGRPDNLRFLIGNADDLPAWFAPESIDRLFLNFSDPWSKKGYRKRRLTYRRYLRIYFTLLREGGMLCFKTDNVGLFDFSLEEIRAMGLTCEVQTRDLHHSAWNEGNVMTEYETNFASQGMPICMLRVRKPQGYVPPQTEA